MYSVLFVDDEPNILSGLKRSLRAVRAEWKVDFAGSGPEALTALGENEIDVVVSDIRMPGMDGVELLSAVRANYPRVIRLALSGHAEAELELECAQAAHQFLAKPADVKQIKQAIDRISMLKAHLDNEDLRCAVSSLRSLPSVPSLYQKIQQEAADPEGTIGAIGEIISQDVAMSAKVLQLVNSAFFGSAREVDTVEKAAALLGFDVLKSLVLAQKVFSGYEDSPSVGLNIDQLANRSQHVAVLAKELAIYHGLPEKDCNHAMLAGMMHTVGKLILVDQFPARYAMVSEAVERENVVSEDAETREFGVSHEMVGGYLLGIWGLPSKVVESVAFQRKPNQSGSTEFSVLSCVYLAINLLKAIENQWDEAKLWEYLDTDYLQQVAPEASVQEWLTLARDHVQED